MKKTDNIEVRFNKLKQKFYNENASSRMPTEDTLKLGDKKNEETNKL